MKKLLVLFLFIITSVTLLSQNEFKYPVYAGALRVGDPDRWVSLTQIDSMNMVNSELVFYIGDAPYFVGDSIATDSTWTSITVDSLIYYTGKLESRVVDSITLTADDNVWQESSKNLYVDPGTGYPFLRRDRDTITLALSNTSNFINSDKVFLNTEDSTNANLYVNRSITQFVNFRSKKFTNHSREGLYVWPDVGDTVKIDGVATVVYNEFQSYVPDPTAFVELNEVNIETLYGGIDGNTSIDALSALTIKVRNAGIDPDSIGKYYGIKHIDYSGNTGLRGADATYFLYSEYGDNYLNGKLDITDDLTITNGGELDQVGKSITVGADIPGFASRTDATSKVGDLTLAHYLTAEENATMIGGVSTSDAIRIYLGGGSTSMNAATEINFNAAADNTTTEGTIIASIDIDGFHVDDITELTTDHGIDIEISHFEDGGITLGTGATVDNIETTITDDDTHLPTSGAVVDYVIASERIMHVIEAQILYSNTTQTTIVTLPADAVVWDIQTEVRTAFTGTGTDLLDIGVTGTANRYEDDLDIAATGFKTMSLSNVPDRMTGSTNITFQYIDENADAGAGEAYVYIHYSLH